MENCVTGLFKPCLRETEGHYGLKSPIMGHLDELNLQFLFGKKLSERLFAFYNYDGVAMTANVNALDEDNVVIAGGSIFQNVDTKETLYPRLVIKKVEARLHT